MKTIKQIGFLALEAIILGVAFAGISQGVQHQRAAKAAQNATATIELPDVSAATATPDIIATQTAVCFETTQVLPYFDGPSPFEHVNGRLQEGEAVISYSHPAYSTEDGWRYVYNGSFSGGWVRQVDLRPVGCGGVK